MIVKDELILRNYKVSGMPKLPGTSSLRRMMGDKIVGVRESRAVGAGLRKENP